MSRRSGQSGTIVQKDGFYKVRFRQDVPGQTERKQCSVNICPDSGPKCLNKPQREHRAREIIIESGADSYAAAEQAHVVTLGTLFKEQAAEWIKGLKERKRKPVKERTITSYESARRWIEERIGTTPLSDVNNSVLRDLVTDAAKAGFKPKTISNYVAVVKAVIASAIKPDGDPVYPRQWNAEYIDMPLVEKEQQRTPSFTAQEIEQIIGEAGLSDHGMLYATLAGAGTRIGEALALEVPNFKNGALHIRESIWNGRITTPKTRAAVRIVDLAPPLAAALEAFIGNRTEGKIFRSMTGTAMSQRNILRRSLTPILKKLKLSEKSGFHGFRRYRVTYLRKQRCPESLLKFWIGHTDEDVTDLYDKLREDVEYRRQIVSEIGLGFEIRTAKKAKLLPMLPKSVKRSIAVSAAAAGV